MNRSKKKNVKTKSKKIRLTFELDEDIRLSDLQGIELPLISTIVDACSVNKQKESESNYKKEKRSKIYQDAIGFQETGLIYTVTEKVKFDRSIIYCHSGLTGDLEVDFTNMYNDERYGNNPNSPLYKPYIENIETFVKSFINGGLHVVHYQLSKAEEECRMNMRLAFYKKEGMPL